MKISNYSVFKKIFFAIIVICALFPLTTCSHLQGALQVPTLSLHSVELAHIDFQGVQLLCKVQVVNPNSFEIPFPQTGWEFFINNNSFINGAINNNNRIRGRATVLVDVPVNFVFLEVINTFRSLIDNPFFGYKVALAFTFNLPVLGDRTFNFEHEGEIPIPRLPRFSAPSFVVQNTSHSGAEVVVSMNVENPNSFDLPRPGINYDVQLNRNSFVSGGMDNTVPLTANETTPVSLRLQLDYPELLRTFSSFANMNEISGLAQFTFDHGIPIFGEPIRYEVSGSIPIPQPPRVSSPTMRIESTDITRTIIVFSLNITNPNVFELPAPVINYDFLINRNSFIRGNVENTTPIPPNSTTPVSVRLQVNYVDLIRSFAALANAREAATVMNFLIDFGIPSVPPTRIEIPGTLPIPRLF